MDDIFSYGYESPAELPASSPPVPSSRGSQKPKRPPPITPKRFKKFFNPRSSQSLGSLSNSRSGRELRDLTSSDVNRRSLEGARIVLEFDDLPTLRSNKRRKGVEEQDGVEYVAGFESSPIRSSPCQRTPQRTRQHETFATPEPAFCLPIRRAPRQLYKPVPISKHVTSHFYSSVNDVHRFETIPFSIAACNTNSLIAAGDELGRVHLIESAKDSKPDFSVSYLSFRPHDYENATMHLAFSSDDGLLATGSGDQTASIIDMPTQTVTHILRGHKSSVKQVAFRPGNDNIVATGCRTGVVCLWDLRSSSQGPAMAISTSSGAHAFGDASEESVRTPGPFSTIIGDHPLPPRSALQTRCSQPPTAQETRSSASITSLKFLEQDRDHLFLTAADATSHLRLWDIRNNYGSRRGSSFPLAIVGGIQSHEKHRHYGVNSLSLSSDGARLYSVCRDSTVYVYSTNHLILGQAPEMDAAIPPRRSKGMALGLGPLYGLRNKRLTTSSFYIRSSIRKATNAHDELLAVGSGGAANGPVVFGTDEKMLRQSTVQKNEGFPIYETGTWLRGAHTAEVTGVAWTSEGELVNLSDDGTARVWREGTGGRQHDCGWADVEDDWLEDDG